MKSLTVVREAKTVFADFSIFDSVRSKKTLTSVYDPSRSERRVQLV